MACCWSAEVSLILAWLLLFDWCVSVAGPAFPSSENTKFDKLFDVLSQSGRQAKSCMVDREFAIGRHATGQCH